MSCAAVRSYRRLRNDAWRRDSSVTIGTWRHNEQVTNHERNGEPWFSLPKWFSYVIYKWWYAIELMILRKYVQVMPWN